MTRFLGLESLTSFPLMPRVKVLFYTQAGVLKPEFEAYTLRFKDVVRLLSFLAEQSQDVKQTMQSELDALLAAY